MIYSARIAFFRIIRDEKQELISKARFVCSSREEAQMIISRVQPMRSERDHKRPDTILEVRVEIDVRIGDTWINGDDWQLRRMLKDIQRALADVPASEVTATLVDDDE